MEVLASPAAMREWRSRRPSGRSLGLVPTMGALHDGHATLIRASREADGETVLSIFVNQLQFNQESDFASYPRTWEQDIELASSLGVTAVYAPTADSMYPEGHDTTVVPGRVSEPMEGQERPGHFVGVATVVAKLFNAVLPHRAYFGAKDFQQLAVIRRMVSDLDYGLEIVSVPTVREQDGLAMSSRNARLSPASRRSAPVLHRALEAAASAHAGGVVRSADLELLATGIINAEAACRIEYVSVADATSLQPVDVVERPAVICVAAWFGDVRLIDNVQIS